jgi:eukaryotic-like serine/threonine-protein kinase
MGLVRAAAGSTIGTYVLERKLGEGGMAEVYLASRSGPHGFTKRVAIKRILPELSDDTQLIQMFCDEARVAATLSHPNIAQVLEFGEHEGELFIVMEYVDGVSCSMLLRTAAQRGEAIPTGAALYIARETLLALSFAHEAVDDSGRSLGIVHRDVSPSNVLVSRIGNVKLIDFGITRSLIAERRTVPGELKGKLRYMSPEQILGAEVDSRSDLFAVGIVLTEMLAGRALFSGKTDLEILTRISRGELGLVRDGGLDKDLANVLERALAHRPAGRFQTARDFARAIDDVAAARNVRLDDTSIVPYLHALGVLPSSSGTRPMVRPDTLAASQARPPSPRRGPPPLPSGPPSSKGPPSTMRAPALRGRTSPMPLPRPPSSRRPSLTIPATRAASLAATAAAINASASIGDSVDRVAIPPSPPDSPAEPWSTPVPPVPEESAAAAAPAIAAPPGTGTEPAPSPAPSGRASGTYRVRTRSGGVVGPLPRAEMLALLATGRLSAKSHVSIKPDSFVQVGNVPALSTLAAHPAYRFREDDAVSPAWLERIETVTVPSALFRLATEKQTGLFVAVDGKRRKRVFFDKGDPVFIASTDRDELLGRRLVASGVVTERSIEIALGSHPPFRLGEALVSFGLLGAAQLVRELSRQLEERLIDLGSWRQGEIRFFPDVVLDQEHHIRTREPTLRVLTDLIRERYAPGDIAAILRPLTKEVLTPTAAREAIAPQLGQSPGDAAVQQLADGTRTVRDIVTYATQGGIPMADSLRAVLIGLCSGCLTAALWPPRNPPKP